MKTEEVTTAARIKREEIIKELHDNYSKHRDINFYTIASAIIDRYSVPLFMDGASWAINHLWHDVSEHPTIGEDIAILCNDKNITDLHVRSEIQWKEAVKIYNVTKWAYQKDLTPNICE